MLVHSSGLSGRQRSRLAPALAERDARVVVPDLTGHGKSAPWPPAALREVISSSRVVTVPGAGHLGMTHAAVGDPILVDAVLGG
jgi:pimeloyl-ACP methyl ester carboxylesterase